MRVFAFFRGWALAERDRWVLWFPVALGTGIALYFSLRVEPPLWLGLAGALAALFLGGRVRASAPGAWVVALGLAALGGGFFAAGWRTYQVQAPVLQARIGPTGVEGRIAALEHQPKAVRATLQQVRISGLHPAATPEKIRLRLAGRQPALTPGDWIRVRAILSPPAAPSAPGAFDFQRHAFFRGLGAVGFGLGAAQVTRREADETAGWALRVEKWRTSLAQTVRRALPGRTGAIASALMTGDRSGIDKTTLDQIRDSGLAHLLAISGLHIGLVAGIVFVAVRAGLALIPALALRYPIKKAAAVAALLAAFAYAQIAGATVPTQRAFLMVGLVLLAVLVDRRGVSLRLVAWAAAVVLILQPEALLSASFQLSFAAVTALIAAYEALRVRAVRARRETGWARRGLVYVAGVAFSTVIAGTATAPFALYHFNHIALYSVAANLIAVPLTALWVMPWAVVAFALMPLGWEQPALTAMGHGVEGVIWIAERVSAWPGGQVYLPAMPTAGLVLAAVGGLWLCLWASPWRVAGVPVLAAAVASVMLVSVPDVLIDGRGRLMAVKAADGRLVFSSARAGGFARETWLHRAGFPADTPRQWPRPGGYSRRDGLSCDGLGCVYRAKGRTVALVRHAAALDEDCWAADVVVSAEPVRQSCPAPGGVIDRFDVWRHGAHAVWLERGGVRIESVDGARGSRPWVLKNKKK